MHNIVLHISIYLFPWLHVLYDLRSINNDRKHAFSAILISVILEHEFLMGGLPIYLYLCTQCMNENDIV